MNERYMVPLLLNSMDADPIKQFERWYQEAEQYDIPLVNAMSLATSNRQGKPSARMVLLKAFDNRGFVFFTNFESRKSQDLTENPFAALVFYWLPLARQIRAEGVVEQLSADESDLYFASRPRGHQLEAHASPQSQVIKSRTYLDELFIDVGRKFDGRTIPRPSHWGGYRVAPVMLEFWQEGENRLHDRLRYRRDNAGLWIIERLAP